MINSGQTHNFLIQGPKLQSDKNSGTTALNISYLLHGSSSDCSMIKISKFSQ